MREQTLAYTRFAWLKSLDVLGTKSPWLTQQKGRVRQLSWGDRREDGNITIYSNGRWGSRSSSCMNSSTYLLEIPCDSIAVRAQRRKVPASLSAAAETERNSNSNQKLKRSCSPTSSPLCSLANNDLERGAWHHTEFLISTWVSDVSNISAIEDVVSNTKPKVKVRRREKGKRTATATTTPTTATTTGTTTMTTKERKKGEKQKPAGKLPAEQLLRPDAEGLQQEQQQRQKQPQQWKGEGGKGKSMSYNNGTYSCFCGKKGHSNCWSIPPAEYILSAVSINNLTLKNEINE